LAAALLQDKRHENFPSRGKGSMFPRPFRKSVYQSFH